LLLREGILAPFSLVETCASKITVTQMNNLLELYILWFKRLFCPVVGVSAETLTPFSQLHVAVAVKVYTSPWPDRAELVCQIPASGHD